MKKIKTVLFFFNLLFFFFLTNFSYSYPHIFGYTFSLNTNWIELECDENHCRGEVVFSITPVTDLLGDTLREFCINSKPHVLPVIQNMNILFEPCYNTRPDIDYGEIPDGYDSVVRVDGTQSCNEGGTPLCLINAHLDVDSVTLSDPSGCIYEGKIILEISGADMVAACRNLPHKITDPEDPNREIVTLSDVPAMIHTKVIPSINVPDRLYYHGNTFSIAVPGKKSSEAKELAPLEAYEVKIRVIESNNGEAVIKAFILDPQGHYTFFPSNVEPISGSWEGATVQPGSGSNAFEATRVAVTSLPNSGEKYVRYILTVRITFQDEEGNITTKRVTYKSNRIRFFTPISCSEDEDPVCVFRPPILRPIPPDIYAERTNRPIFTGLLDTDGDGRGDTADYNNYTGTACDTCISTDRSYVQPGYWIGGAAKDGVWFDWYPASEKGRVGIRVFLFKNARPWDVYVLCPKSDFLRPSGPDYYDACASASRFSCPGSGGSSRGVMEGSEFTVLWTVHGWMCMNYLCKEQPSEEPTPEALKCD